MHILGHPVDLDPILEAARRYNLRVIEDATEGLGARYRDRPLGGVADMGCFSFNGNKIITTGGGGMLVTNNEDWARKAKYLTTQAKEDGVEYIHSVIGFNYRLTNLQAAMGCAQMEQLDDYVTAKRRIATHYADALGPVPGLVPPEEAEWAFNTWWMYTVLVDDRVAGIDSRKLISRLGARGIQCRPLWQPLHASPAHPSSVRWECPVAERLYRQAISLPCSVGLGRAQQEYVTEAILENLTVRE